MQKIDAIGLIGIVLSGCIMYADAPLSIEVHAKQFAKVKLFIGVVGDASLDALAQVVKKDLAFTGQFDVTVRAVNAVTATSDVTSLFTQGYPLALFLSMPKKEQEVAWRLYDTSSAMMLAGKQCHKRGSSDNGWAHTISDALWPVLTAQDGFFSSRIAYCKEAVLKGKRKVQHIYIADYDGSNEQCIVKTPTVNVAPRFNRDAVNPLLFYSESTSSNIRLMVMDTQHRRTIASNFDGINMLPTFSQDGKRVVYCASRGNGSCQLYYFEKGNFKCLTSSNGNNISPSLTDDGNRLFYCSDGNDGKPQIYCLDLVTGGQPRQITKGTGAAFSSCYCGKRNLLAYTKKTNGFMQVFVYDEKKGIHEQLTFDASNKDECSWSPCGSHLLYCVEQGTKSMLAMLTMQTKQQRFITASKDACSYPTWSPLYAQYPEFVGA